MLGGVVPKLPDKPCENRASFNVSIRLLGIRSAIYLTAWLGVLAVAAFLRLDQLAVRPVHCDEATGARLLAKRMESGRAQFDPTHFHGPLQSLVAEPVCRLRGETTWPSLTQRTLRTAPALAGILTVMLPLLWRRRFGDAPMLLAGAMLAVSPLLVYYSRMFIHETLLGFAGLLALMAILSRPRHGLPGVFLAMVFAAKESVVISMIAWLCAGLALALWNHRALTRERLKAAWSVHRWSALWSLLAFVVCSIAFYSDGFRHPHGVVDSVRTFLIYKTGEGHDQPFHHYLQLLLWPHKSAGIWWFGTPVGLLAAVAVARAFLTTSLRPGTRIAVQFIALGTAAHFMGYGLIAYKTPWLMVFPWIQVCLLAGFAVADWKVPLRRPVTVGLALTIAFTGVTQFRQTRFANGRLASDERNPFAYVPTRRNIESVGSWLQQVAAVSPEKSVEPIAVIGNGYWPLPWYLRQFHTIGYWAEPPTDLARFPVVFAVPETESAVTANLTSTHTPLPRGLRANVSITLYLRNDIWQAWMQADRQP